MKKIIVTTSWDDGSVEDLRILNLLNKYNLKGTFYVPKNINFEIKKGKYLQRISDKEILEIAKTQEIGAHTMNHTYLNKLHGDELYSEIKNSKDWIELLLNKKIRVFACPGGIFNSEIIETIKKSGFIGANVGGIFNVEIKDPFLVGFSAHCYPCFPKNKEWGLFLKSKITLGRIRVNIKGIKKFNLPIISILRWNILAKNIFNYILENGGIFHLHGHSWEIERYKIWDDLEDILKYISNRDNVLYLTNSETIENS